MQINVKKKLAARTLKVGESRVVFNRERLDEIKEAITKQDIKDLVKDKAIVVKEIKGTKTRPKRKTRRRMGSMRKKVNTRKKDYMTITRKLRAYVMDLRDKDVLEREDYWKLRREIRARQHKSKAQLRERVKQIKELGETGK